MQTFLGLFQLSWALASSIYQNPKTSIAGDVDGGKDHSWHNVSITQLLYYERDVWHKVNIQVE